MEGKKMSLFTDKSVYKGFVPAGLEYSCFRY